MQNIILFRGISTSFEGKYGNIRYWLKAEVEKPWGFNHKTKKAFTVISPIDINRREYLVSDYRIKILFQSKVLQIHDSFHFYIQMKIKLNFRFVSKEFISKDLIKV